MQGGIQNRCPGRLTLPAARNLRYKCGVLSAPPPANPSLRPVVSYFLLTYALSWTGALVVAAPYLVRHQTVPKAAGLLMFPVMLLGPSCAGLFFTWRTGGRTGLRDLRRRMARLSAPTLAYGLLAVPPVLVWTVLTFLARTVSPRFAPNHFWLGAAFGILAGFLEEIGWTGFALPRLLAHYSVFRSGVVLGILWGLWHLPVIDFLGTATSHGSAWLPFCVAFIAAMTAVRILMAYQYAPSASVLLAQFLHMSSTGSLVVFSAPRVSGMQEAFWYGVYACALLAVGVALRSLANTRHIP